MDSVRILKTEMSVTNIDGVAKNLVFKNKISVAICNANTLVRCYKDKELNNTINFFDIRCRIFHHDRSYNYELANKLPSFKSYQPLVAQIWTGLNRLLEPIYGPIRRILPNTQPLDLSPLVAFIILISLRDYILPELFGLR